MKRRDIIKIIGAAGGLAATGCSKPYTDGLFPYLIQPEDVVPGMPTWYATTCRECPAGCGMWMKNMEGRPIKAEGNPEHPINRGALCARGQASLQRLYHPRRFHGPMARANGKLAPISWDEALGRISSSIIALKNNQKANKVALVTGSITGSVAGLVDQWLTALGAPVRITYEAFGCEGWRAANRQAFGVAEVPALRIDKAEYLLSFGSNFLDIGSPVENGRQLADARSRWGKGRARFVALCPRQNLTAANSDRWIPVRPGPEAAVAMAMVNVILSAGHAPPDGMGDVALYRNAAAPFNPSKVAEWAGIPVSVIEDIARNFIRGKPSLALAGETDSMATWTAVNMLNALVGNINATMLFGTGTASDWAKYENMAQLIDRMSAKDVEVLFVHASNPSYSLPGALKFDAAAQKTPLVVSFSDIPDETTELAHLVLPANHFLESWGDYSPRAGIVSLVQPARRPLYDTRHFSDILIQLAQKTGLTDIAYKNFNEVRDKFWMTQLPATAVSGDFWVDVRHKGGAWSDFQPQQVQLQPAAFQDITSLNPAEAGKIKLLPALSALLYDGRGIDAPWLRETPDPVSKIAWDGWVELHPTLASKIGVEKGSVVRVETRHGFAEWPVWVTESIHPEAISIPTGIRGAEDGAFSSNVMQLMPTAAQAGGGVTWTAEAKVVPTGRSHRLAYLMGSDDQFDRGITRDTEYIDPKSDFEEWKERNTRRKPPMKDMYAPHKHPDYRWGMAIDLDRCTGCSACVVACYAENNLPVAGHDQLLRRREMAWLRLERFYEKRGDELKARFTPMLCQHCDYAPCETVCPVFASYHTPEGLNAQIYNRCVGTRYCSNNCPYKVRRFNWFTYKWPEPLNQQLNPDVSARTKGVMEKCTFCVQRITAAKIAAKGEGRKVRDGEIAPACAQTCPTGAIIFGNLNDPESRVSKISQNDRGYKVLMGLDTHPSITYLKRIARTYSP